MDDYIKQSETVSLLIELTKQDFLNIGLHQVAYIKPADGDQNFTIYAADGSQISVMDSYDNAINIIRVNDLYPVTLH